MQKSEYYMYNYYYLKGQSYVANPRAILYTYDVCKNCKGGVMAIYRYTCVVVLKIPQR